MLALRLITTLKSFLFIALMSYLAGCSTADTMAQDLSKHRWENRLIIMQADDAKNTQLLQQIKTFSAETEGLRDRKLLVYQCFGGEATEAFDPKKQTALNNRVSSAFQQMNGPFKLLLVGLDGGIKLRSESPVTVNQIFGLIDTMPMRRAEQARKKND